MPVTIDGTTGISGPASGLTDLNASNLSTGTVPDARFPATLPAASGANLTNLNASNISTGTLAVANGGTGVTTSTGTGSVVLSNSPTLVTPALGTPSSGNGSNLTNLNASNLSTGTVPTARLGSGTADSTTFLRGDGTWAAAGGAPASLGAIGAVLDAAVNSTSSLKFGDTVAGSNCYYATQITATLNAGVFSEGSGGALPYTSWGNTGDGATRQTSGNTGYTAPGGSTTLSGTWRVLSMTKARSSGYDPCVNQTTSVTYCALIQRIS